MKKKLLAGVATGAILLGMGATAHATQFTDTIDRNKLFNAHRTIFRYTHNLLDDGFDPTRFTVTTAELDIFLFDDTRLNGKPDGAEKFRIRLDGLWSGKITIPDGADLTQELSVASCIQDDGILKIILKRTTGDFYFDKSVLTVDATPVVADPPRVDAAPVPEPATMLFMGTGLTGIAAVSRRRKTGKN